MPRSRGLEARFSPHHTALALIVAGVFALSAARSAIPTVDVARGHSTTERASSAVSHTIGRLQRSGLVCTRAATVTDTVVFEYLHHGGVHVVSFDRAYQLGRAGRGWVRAYCA